MAASAPTVSSDGFAAITVRTLCALCMRDLYEDGQACTILVKAVGDGTIFTAHPGCVKNRATQVITESLRKISVSDDSSHGRENAVSSTFLQSLIRDPDVSSVSVGGYAIDDLFPSFQAVVKGSLDIHNLFVTHFGRATSVVPIRMVVRPARYNSATSWSETFVRFCRNLSSSRHASVLSLFVTSPKTVPTSDATVEVVWNVVCTHVHSREPTEKSLSEIADTTPATQSKFVQFANETLSHWVERAIRPSGIIGAMCLSVNVEPVRVYHWTTANYVRYGSTDIVLCNNVVTTTDAVPIVAFDNGSDEKAMATVKRLNPLCLRGNSLPPLALSRFAAYKDIGEWASRMGRARRMTASPAIAIAPFEDILVERLM